MSDAVQVIITIKEKIIAEKIAHALVENNLAAGVQINDVNSIYKWDDKIHEHIEYVLNIKTMNYHFDAIEAIIDNLHPYIVPPIEQIKIEKGKLSYLEWIKSNTKI